MSVCTIASSIAWAGTTMAVASELGSGLFSRCPRLGSNRKYPLQLSLDSVSDQGSFGADILLRSMSAPAALAADLCLKCAECDDREQQAIHSNTNSDAHDVSARATGQKKRRRLETIKEEWLTLKRATSAPADLNTNIAQASSTRSAGEIEVVSWNIASPNLNPFEYWVTHESEEYSHLMCSVQKAIDDPDEEDIEIGKIFTQHMFQELKDELLQHGVNGLEELDRIWKTELVCAEFTLYIYII